MPVTSSAKINIFDYFASNITFKAGADNKIMFWYNKQIGKYSLEINLIPCIIQVFSKLLGTVTEMGACAQMYGAETFMLRLMQS